MAGHLRLDIALRRGTRCRERAIDRIAGFGCRIYDRRR